MKPSELLQLQKETGQSYWDMIGRPLEAPKKMSREEIEYQKIMDRVDKIQPLPEFKGGKRGKKKSGYYTSDGHYVRYDSGDQYWNILGTAQRKQFQDFVNYFRSQGWSDIDIAGMAGNIMQESGFIPTAVSPADKYGHRYHGLFQNQDKGGLRDRVIKIYGDHSSQSQMAFVNDMMQGNAKKVGKDIVNYGKDYHMGSYKTPAEASKAFRQVYERPTDPRDIVRDIYAGYAYDIINKQWPLQQKQTVAKQTPVLEPAVQEPAGIPYTAPTYTPASIGVMQQRMPTDADILVDQRTFADYVPPQYQAPHIDIPASTVSNRRSILDFWRNANAEDYDDMYYYRRGKSYQFPFWNRQWNVLTPPIKYGCGKRGG